MNTKPFPAVTAAEAEQDFSGVAAMAEENGHVTVYKDGRPKYLVVDLDTEPQIFFI